MQLLKLDYTFVRTNVAMYVAVKSVQRVSEHSVTSEHTECTKD